MPSEVVVELLRGVEEGVVFMGVAFRGLPVGRSQLRLLQWRDRALQGSTHTDTAYMGLTSCRWITITGMIPHRDAVRIGIKPVAVSLSNAPPTVTPSSAMARFGPLGRRGHVALALGVPTSTPLGRVSHLRAVDASVVDITATKRWSDS
jgi:hypothetical protein